MNLRNTELREKKLGRKDRAVRFYLHEMFGKKHISGGRFVEICGRLGLGMGTGSERRRARDLSWMIDMFQIRCGDACMTANLLEIIELST